MQEDRTYRQVRAQMRMQLTKELRELLQQYTPRIAEGMTAHAATADIDDPTLRTALTQALMTTLLLGMMSTMREAQAITLEQYEELQTYLIEQYQKG